MGNEDEEDIPLWVEILDPIMEDMPSTFLVDVLDTSDIREEVQLDG